jgi:L-fucose isomerase-like protein
MDDAALAGVLAVRDQMLALGRDHGLDAFAVQDFMSLVEEFGAYCFFADSLVAERYPIGYESDVHGALTNLLLQRSAFNEQPAFLADMTVRHPDDDNGVLLWHAGAPVSMKHPQAQVRLGRHWILPGPFSGMTHYRLKDGPITVARFDGDGGRYALAAGEGDSIEGPETLNNYVWMKVDDWPRWERILIEGPFIHHTGMIYGRYARALLDACRYVPGLEPVRLNADAGA